MCVCLWVDPYLDQGALCFETAGGEMVGPSLSMEFCSFVAFSGRLFVGVPGMELPLLLFLSYR